MQQEKSLYILKRNGIKTRIDFNKVSARIKALATDPILGNPLSEEVIINTIQYVINGLISGMKTRELDLLGADWAAKCIPLHPDYGVLAARLLTSNLHKETLPLFSTTYALLSNHRRVCSETAKFVAQHAKELDAAIIHLNDYRFDDFGLRTLMSLDTKSSSYLKKINGEVVERPQYLYMRMAVAIHYPDMKAILETYNALSYGKVGHATPTMFNAGSIRPQLASCFLINIKDDSIDGIFESLWDCANISKYAGGIGVSIHNIRASGTLIEGTDGFSNGIVPMLRLYERMALYVDQGGGKRKGSVAIYLEPWHAVSQLTQPA